MDGKKGRVKALIKALAKKYWQIYNRISLMMRVLWNTMKYFISMDVETIILTKKIKKLCKSKKWVRSARQTYRFCGCEHEISKIYGRSRSNFLPFFYLFFFEASFSLYHERMVCPWSSRGFRVNKYLIELINMVFFSES